MKNFQRLTTLTFLLTLVVILWGAYVRASSSGAGCGSHWPLCNGQLLPIGDGVHKKTLVEFFHRATSGISLLLCFATFVYSLRFRVTRPLLSKFALLSLIFFVMEAVIGAGLVLLELTDQNSSSARAIAISLHLVNTFFLLFFLSGLIWASRQNAATQEFFKFRDILLFKIEEQKLLRFFSLVSFFLMLVVGTSGAIVALGDTLFPVSSLREGLMQDLSPTVHFLIKLRIYHPLIALFTSFVLLFYSYYMRTHIKSARAYFFSMFLSFLVITQFSLGILNWILLAPVWMQITHLLFADLLWITLSINYLVSFFDAKLASGFFVTSKRPNKGALVRNPSSL